MTDVIDDSLSWEQRRELRRKKRQELLAETDRYLTNLGFQNISSCLFVHQKFRFTRNLFL